MGTLTPLQQFPLYEALPFQIILLLSCILSIFGLLFPACCCIASLARRSGSGRDLLLHTHKHTHTHPHTHHHHPSCTGVLPHALTHVPKMISHGNGISRFAIWKVLTTFIPVRDSHKFAGEEDSVVLGARTCASTGSSHRSLGKLTAMTDTRLL